jgi:hypothetical protein
MDIITPLMPVLSAALPYLLGFAGKVGDGIAENIGGDIWEKAQAVWTKLRPKVEARAAAQEAIEDVAKNPEDADLQAALRVQLRKILDGDVELAAAIAEILKGSTPPNNIIQIQQSVMGEGNQTIGQMQGQAKVIGTVKGDVTM